ncbi:MAG: hypothetical protein QOC89_783 [Paraburkholderia sp.]|jgi:hypothetical protein|uniref:hypothetical protein n=1 Tax=Paraburkholderia sp. TaxID=1926495 RepID=UPI002AFEE284|nr:hypothetical protein [Paraburkholderia sp.]MEA3083086.1 hypothetical protein [Paraburkholderia sp.]MEA3131078.1 hypothetical protein [Paraburkholderia sp.]
MEFLLICFAAGLILAIPVWIVWQRAGSRRGLAAIRHFDPRDAVPCDIEPVALRARLLPDAARAPGGPS